MNACRGLESRIADVDRANDELPLACADVSTQCVVASVDRQFQQRREVALGFQIDELGLTVDRAIQDVDVLADANDPRAMQFQGEVGRRRIRAYCDQEHDYREHFHHVRSSSTPRSGMRTQSGRLFISYAIS